MKRYIFIISIALLACGGVGVFSSDTDTSTDQEALDHYRVQCKAGCQHLYTLPDETDEQKPCVQAREHNGMDCVDYCVHKMQRYSHTNPTCWTKLKACADFEEQCHFGELY